MVCFRVLFLIKILINRLLYGGDFEGINAHALEYQYCPHDFHIELDRWTSDLRSFGSVCVTN